MSEHIRARLESALAKPLSDDQSPRLDEFDPWEDVIRGIHGSYAADSDALFIRALEAVRDAATFEFIDREGFAGELALYVLSGHGYLEYGTSPRGGWWDHALDGLLVPLIDKWRAYYQVTWGEPLPTPPGEV